MLINASTVPADTTLAADICVIGAGPAGLTVADELRARGVDVLVVESGDEHGSGNDEPDGDIDADAQPYVRFAHSTARGFGGTAQRWVSKNVFRIRPLDELDFTSRPEVGREGWPIDRAELDRFYPRAQQILGTGPFDYAPQRWSDADAPDLARLHGMDEVVTAVFQFGPSDGVVRRRDQFAAARDVQILTRATVLDMVADDPGTGARVERLVVGVTPEKGRRAEPHTFAVEARTVVLATGGIGNARMLLASNGRYPNGLGNTHDLVGRHFMEHPHIRTGLLVPADPGVFDQVTLYAQHRVDGVRVKGKLRLTDEVLRRESLLGSVWYVSSVDDDRASDVGYAAVDLRQTIAFRKVVPGTLRRMAVAAPHPLTALRAARDRNTGQPRALRLQAMAEQRPNPHSRVTLSDRRDAFGQPLAKLSWRVSDDERASIRRTQELLDAAVRKAGVGHIERLLGDEDPPALVNGGYHHMGTTRMHPDPRHGVVDADCRVHGIANLYLAGSSVFPTSGYANPTLTLVALAVRLADHLARQAPRGTNRSAAPTTQGRPS
jgi:choline dehydrogenase-like flavoprotein